MSRFNYTFWSSTFLSTKYKNISLNRRRTYKKRFHTILTIYRIIIVRDTREKNQNVLFCHTISNISSYCILLKKLCIYNQIIIKLKIINALRAYGYS